MTRDPAKRQQSALELVRDLQRVEAELGLVATQADVAMDDWALASIGDQGDRTIVRAVVPRAAGATSGRRRRRRVAEAAAAPLDTAPELVPTAGSVAARRSRVIAGAIVLAALAVISLGVTATVIAIQAGDRDLPRVSNVEAALDGTTVIFSWDDPGIEADDSYQVSLGDGTEAFQRSNEFAVAASSGDRVCVTVRVAREGRLGPASDEKCAEVAGG